ncbi:19734_t:CDS:2 [Funneliformis geosporum]|uniref:7553_t:CDS:1 n=1 Tax=Funneliformis geosporum TaxID=1117311 RepID=A0A9W4SRT2_9GLOM|nr:19734_t:CDS:2 [Funneliformis geosporum]CAI2179229.1 7553_t:CDS:2 [Funneliformis geosporum]
MQKGPVHMLRQHWSKFKDGNTKTKRFNRPQKWVHPKNRIERWKIFEGDIVKVMVGRAKNEVGKIKSVDKLSNRIWIENVNMGRMTKPKINLDRINPENKDKTGGWWLAPVLKPIHVSNVMHIHPDDINDENKQNSEKRAVRSEWKKVEIDENETRWRRVIAGTKTVIPFPKKPKEPEREKSPFDTSSEIARQLTWNVSLDPPLPPGVIDELRTPYKGWRYNAQNKNRPFI